MVSARAREDSEIAAILSETQAIVRIFKQPLKREDQNLNDQEHARPQNVEVLPLAEHPHPPRRKHKDAATKAGGRSNALRADPQNSTMPVEAEDNL